MEQEEVDGGGDAAAAVRDHLAALVHPHRVEALARGLGRHEGAGLRVEQRRRGHAHASGDAPPPPVTARGLAAVELLRERVDEQRILVPDRPQHRVPVDEEAGARAGLEVCARMGGRFGGKGTPFPGPLVEAAVEHRRREAVRAQHPPYARRPHDASGAIEHHPEAGADAVARHRLAEAFGRGQHEEELGLRIGELVDQVEEGGTGNVAPLVVRASRLRPVGHARVGSDGAQVDGAVEDAQVRIVEMRLEPLGAHDGIGITVLHRAGSSAHRAPDPAPPPARATRTEIHRLRIKRRDQCARLATPRPTLPRPS